MPFKSIIIDGASGQNKNGSDMYIGRIIKEHLSQSEIISVSQAFRGMRDSFNSDDAISKINSKLKDAINVSEKSISISADLSSKNSRDNQLSTYLDGIAFHFAGKGEQCLVKTKLALTNKKAKEASVLLLEEPESHLSYSTLNSLLNYIEINQSEKQVIISTHSNFVINKLGLQNLILLNRNSVAREVNTTKISDLSTETQTYFKKLSGYDTLRLILCKKAILVEGDSDELIVQKAYFIKYGKLPIGDGVDVISVGTAFLRFLEISKILKKETAVVTDNDGEIEAVTSKYDDYIGKYPFIKILFSADLIPDSGLTIGKGKKAFNYNTLEPHIVLANSLSILNSIFEKKFKNENDLHRFMYNNKTDVALKLFESESPIKFPKYILDSI